MFIVNLGMQSQCQVLHLISLIQHSQQPCKVGIMPILPMQLSRLKEFKPKVTWLKKGIARIEFQICLVPKPALWGSGRSKGRKKKNMILSKDAKYHHAPGSLNSASGQLHEGGDHVSLCTASGTWSVLSLSNESVHDSLHRAIL